MPHYRNQKVLKISNQTPKVNGRPAFSWLSAPQSQWDRLVPVYTTGTKRPKLTKEAISLQNKWNSSLCQARAVHWTLMIKGDRLCQGRGGTETQPVGPSSEKSWHQLADNYIQDPFTRVPQLISVLVAAHEGKILLANPNHTGISPY